MAEPEEKLRRGEGGRRTGGRGPRRPRGAPDSRRPGGAGWLFLLLRAGKFHRTVGEQLSGAEPRNRGGGRRKVGVAVLSRNHLRALPLRNHRQQAHRPEHHPPRTGTDFPRNPRDPASGGAADRPALRPDRDRPGLRPGLSGDHP